MSSMWIFILIFIYTSHSINAEVKVITDHNWKDFMENEWMILLHAPWCPACRSIKPDWEIFSDEITKDYPITIGSIDITQNPVVSGSFSISRLPTFFHIKNGVFRQYTGDRRSLSLVKFIKEEGYKSIEPLKWYYNPSSIHMRAVGHLFHLSQIIMNFQQSLQTNYGMSAWMTYLIIGGVVVASGLSISLSCFFLMMIISRPRSHRTCHKHLNKPEAHVKDLIVESECSSVCKEVFNVEEKVSQISLNEDDQGDDGSENEDKKTR